MQGQYMSVSMARLFVALTSIALCLIWWFGTLDGSAPRSATSEPAPQGRQFTEQQAQERALPQIATPDGHGPVADVQKNHRVGATRTKLSKDGKNRSLGDYLSSGLNEMSPDIALDVARMISYCQALPLLSAAHHEEAAKTFNDSQRQTRLSQDSQGLTELGFECQTVPSNFLDGRQELQARQKLIKRAYDNGVAGAAVEYAKLPAALIDVPENELYSRVTQDAMSGNIESIQLLMENEVLRERTDALTLKILAFGMQRAVNGELGDRNLRLSQASIASSLWREWSADNPSSKAMMYGMPSTNGKAIQYPPNFVEPNSAEYIEKSKLFDLKIKITHSKSG